MKYVIILPDGAADEPVAQLQNRTPLEAANIPNMDWVAKNGVQGRSITVPSGFTPGTDVATLSLFGYEPRRYYSGRAPLEAAAKGLAVSPDQIVFRCNFVTITDGRMRDFTAGHISQNDADEFIATLNGALKDKGCDFYSGVSYRNLLLLSNALDLKLTCTPPHDIADQEVATYWPKGEGVDRVMEIMNRGATLLKDHAVNAKRKAQGKSFATNIWLWGQGRPTTLEPFSSKYGLSGAVITGVDIIRGIAVCMGMKLIPVAGATGYIDTDYAAKGAAALNALDDFDIVVVHVEAADEAGHLGDTTEKVKALEQIDEKIVGPLLKKLQSYPAWRMLVAPDHPTPIGTKAHSAAPPPFCYAATGIAPDQGKAFSEKSAKACGLFFEDGTEIIRRFLA